MKLRKYTQGVTIFIEPQMYCEVKKVSDEAQVSLSEIFRQMITEYPDETIYGDAFRLAHTTQMRATIGAIRLHDAGMLA